MLFAKPCYSIFRADEKNASPIKIFLKIGGIYMEIFIKVVIGIAFGLFISRKEIKKIIENNK